MIRQAVERPHAGASVDERRTTTYRELVWGANVLADHVDRLCVAAGGVEPGSPPKG